MRGLLNIYEGESYPIVKVNAKCCKLKISLLLSNDWDCLIQEYNILSLDMDQDLLS